jgi:hypothetical protein
MVGYLRHPSTAALRQGFNRPSRNIRTIRLSDQRNRPERKGHGACFGVDSARSGTPSRYSRQISEAQAEVRERENPAISRAC